jgi:hypothetical protein
MYSNYTEYGTDRYWYTNNVRRVNIALMIICIVWGLYSIITYRKYVQVTVSSFYWYRAINIEEWQKVIESDWHVPVNGREIRSYRAYYTSERYACGSETTGTGDNRRTHTKYCSRSVYRTKYDYEIDRWIVIDRYERQGVTQDNIIWPNVEDLHMVGTIHLPIYGDRKAGQYISQYTVNFIDTHGEYYKADMTETIWFTFKQGSKHKLILGFFNNIIEIQ